MCIDHFCQSHHPIVYLQHFHAILESFIFYIKCRSAVIGSPQITKTALSWVGWAWRSWQRSREVRWEWGAYHNQAEKCFGHCRFAKSAGRAESEILIAHIFPNSSILLAWQCLWNPKTVLFCRQVSTWRMAQHGGVAADFCTADWIGGVVV